MDKKYKRKRKMRNCDIKAINVFARKIIRKGSNSLTDIIEETEVSINTTNQPARKGPSYTELTPKMQRYITGYTDDMLGGIMGLFQLDIPHSQSEYTVHYITVEQQPRATVCQFMPEHRMIQRIEIDLTQYPGVTDMLKLQMLANAVTRPVMVNYAVLQRQRDMIAAALAKKNNDVSWLTGSTIKKVTLLIFIGLFIAGLLIYLRYKKSSKDVSFSKWGFK